MGVKLNISFKFKVNGKEYGSAKDMPESARKAAEQACANLPGPHPDGITLTRSTRIVVNGQEYAGVEAMPAEVRQMYEKAMAAAVSGHASIGPGHERKPGSAAIRLDSQRLVLTPDGLKPAAPEPTLSTRWLILMAVVLGLVLGLCLLIRLLR
jgi:hypothetical protein